MSRVLSTRTGAAAGTTSTGGEDWRDRAACLGTDPALWHAADGERADERRWRLAEAKAVCRTCPVKSDCLTDGLRTSDQWGVRAGLDLGSLSRRDLGRLRDQHRNAGADLPAPKVRAPYASGKPTDRPDCGTKVGYDAHTAAGERQCDTCRQWRSDYRSQPCGTIAAYRRHHGRGEPACDPCKAAKATYSKERRALERRGDTEQAA